ncbi:uncharacterized protein TrAtP1_005047 [Trichoderma atroviride]|uniref:uncharacterized protein n=1 Tax=Hypocrea atroviridis TaxID=63577 RepID=UPI00332D1BE6|nr:hypothetical protein TrAtP1_005047 [Trichoderma atroviride]
MLPTLPPHGATYEQATLLGVVLCLLTALLRYLPTRSVKYLPGPKPLPLLGNIIYFSRVLKNLPVEVPLMAKRFGGTCMMWMGSKPSVMIHSLEDAHELLTKRGAVTASRPRKNIFMQHIWPNILPFAPAGEEMRFFRRIYTDILGPKQSQQVRKYQDYEATVSLLAFCEAPDDYESHTSNFAISVIFSAVYGTRVSRRTHPLMVELQDIWSGVLSNAQPGSLLIDWLPFLEKLPLRFQPWLKLADSLHARDCAVHMAFLKLLRKQIDAGIAPVCFGVNAIAHQKKEGFDDDLLLGICTAIIVAGGESTASMMHSFIKLMALHPEVQQRAQEEIDRVVGPSRLPTWKDHPNLPYTRAIIKELGRFAPLLTFSFPHYSTEEFVYQGYTIPNNTLLLPCADNLNRDRTRYDDADTFRPERFLGDDMESHMSARQTDYRKRDHVNYGFGRRIQVAENSLFIQITRFLWAFDTTPRPGEPPLDMLDTHERLTRRPKPFKVNITPRSDAVLEVIQQAAKELHTNIPDIDSIDMDR